MKGVLCARSPDSVSGRCEWSLASCAAPKYLHAGYKPLNWASGPPLLCVDLSLIALSLNLKAHLSLLTLECTFWGDFLALFSFSSTNSRNELPNTVFLS